MKTILILMVSLAAGGGEDSPVVPTTLTAVREHPHAFRNVRVTFTVQYAWLGKIQNPFFTRFVPSHFANFHAWADEQPIWRRKQYDDVFGLLFLSKNNPQLPELFDLRTYDRVRVTAIVRNTFQGEPWIEVTELERVSGGVNTGTLAHLYRGEFFMKQRKWRAAISELSLVGLGDVPDAVRAAVHKNLGTCYLRVGEAGRARSHLARAREYTHGVDHELERLTAAAAERPETQLDRAVDRKSIELRERPLWEAFEKAAPRPAK